MQTRRILAGTLLASLAVLSWWLYQQVNEDSGSDTRRFIQVVDYYFQDFHLRAMDAEGRPRYVLRAKRMEHFEGQDSSVLEQPSVDFATDSGPPWHVKSERGLVDSRADKIVLLGNVELERRASAAEREFQAYTRDLLVMPEAGFAETLQPVVMLTDGTRIEGTGMRAYLSEDRLDLLADVKVVHKQDVD